MKRFSKITLISMLVIGALSFSNTKTSRTRISGERAKQIALSRVPGATKNNIVDFDADRNSYDGTIKYKGYEYDFEINAYTGKVIEWDVDRD